MCVSVCPKNVIVAGGQLNKRGLKPAIFKDTGECIGCAMCAVICPECCIEVWK